jgi:MFS transporter, FSR family, fosmidomycin resistance protein
MNTAVTSHHNVFNLKILLVLSLGHLVTDIYQGSLPAILPFLKENLSLSYAMTGAIMMAANLTSSVIQPLFGYLSDRKGKVFLLPLGCLLAGVGLSLLSLPSNYASVIVLVVISGLGVASFHPEGYKTAHFFTGDRMATGMSVFSVGGNLGFALGPIISIYIVTHLGFSFLPLMMVFSVIFISLLFFAWKSLTSVQPVSATRTDIADDVRKGAYVSLALIIGTVVMRSWTQFGLMTYIPFYVINYLNGDPIHAGQLVSVFLLGGVAGTIAGSPLADRWGYKRYLILSMTLTSVLFPVIFVATGAMLSIALFIIGVVLISTFTVTIVMAQQLLPQNLGIASGLMVGFAIGTGGLGVTILGIIADYSGLPAALEAIWALPVAGVILSLLIKYPLPATKRVLRDEPGTPRSTT